MTQVVLRVDFVPPPELAKGLPTRISNVALSRFPIAEPQRQVAQQFQFSGSELTTQKSESTVWNFHNRDRTKTLTIGPGMLFLVAKQYERYETLRSEFFAVWDALSTSFRNLAISRLGLRYINEISWDEGSATDWRGLLDARLLTLFDFKPDDSEFSRVFQVLELRSGDLQTKFQFGMHNPDYPSPIRKKVFVLDLDGFYLGPQDRAELERTADAAHASIQSLFETSITDRLRQRMR